MGILPIPTSDPNCVEEPSFTALRQNYGHRRRSHLISLPRLLHLDSSALHTDSPPNQELLLYELFVKLYNWNKVELCPSGLINYVRSRICSFNSDARFRQVMFDLEGTLVSPVLQDLIERFPHVKAYKIDASKQALLWNGFFKRKSSSGSGSSNNVDSSNTVGSSRTPSSRQSQLDDVLGNLQADPGLRTRIIDYDANLRDEVRRLYLQKGPCQPRGHNFPITNMSGINRRFIPQWFDEFDWLEYSVSKDAAFCLYCYLFKTNFEQVGSEAFTGDGFKNWKKGRERFKMHVGPVGSVHNKAREAATNLMNQATHIETAVSKHSDQTRKAYRTCLIASIKCTKFLLRQGLPFRGHDESATSSNRGNYLELLQFLADNNDKVREVVMENAPGNLKLLAPSIQKEIVNSCALETLDAIMDGLKDRFFSILVDEARDVSVKEQMAMVLRYVDDNGHVIERFVGIQHVTDTTSSSLKDVIDTLFSRYGLSISKLRGQGYDGASNMRGELNGLKTKILREQPCAYYVHCFAHQLQLALVAVAKNNIDIASFFATANNVVNHVGASCKRRDSLRGQLQEELVIAFENDCLITGRGLNQETSLKHAGDTRWNSHYGTLISIISMFSSVVHVLQMVIDDNPNESAGEANTLMRVILTFEFVFHLFLMKVILGLTNDLSQALQRKDQEIVNAMALVKSCKEKLYWMRNNGFDALVDEVSSFCEKHHIDVPNMEEAFILPRRSRRYAPIKTNRHHYRVELFIYVIDEQITELEDRFNEDIQTKEIIGRGTKRDGLYYVDDVVPGRAHLVHSSRNSNLQKVLMSALIPPQRKVQYAGLPEGDKGY
ncbi:uncharacterized protein [Malus domestica]|uniref:uncharacterized protein n=1 Tax=Malus domestica TaxID=3750 RepID=UPI0039753E5B